MVEDFACSNTCIYRYVYNDINIYIYLQIFIPMTYVCIYIKGSPLVMQFE